MWAADLDINVLLGKTLIDIRHIKRSNDDDEQIIFTTKEGEKYSMYHKPDCCESVTVEDIIGDLDDLIGKPLLMAEKATSNQNPAGIIKEYQDSFTWTFYKFATVRGYVTIRWYGSSNGYYSEGVSFSKID